MAPLPYLAADVDAAAIGEYEVEEHRIRRAMRQRVERLLLRAGGINLEARVAKDDAKAPDDLRLVVDYENARALVHPTNSG
jgi:hypothetical protein